MELTADDYKKIADVVLAAFNSVVCKTDSKESEASTPVNDYQPDEYLDYLLNIKNNEFVCIKEVLNEKGDKEIVFTKQSDDGSGKEHIAIIKRGQEATVFKPDGSIDYNITYSEEENEPYKQHKLGKLIQEWSADKPGELSFIDMANGKTNKIGYVRVTIFPDGKKRITKRLGNNIVKLKLDSDGKETEYAEYIYNKQFHCEQLIMSREYNYNLKDSYKNIYFDEEGKVKAFKEIRTIKGEKEERWFDKNNYRIYENGEPYVYSSEEEMQDEWYPVMSLKTICQSLSGRKNAKLTEQEAEFLSNLLGLEDPSVLNNLQDNKETYRTLARKYHPDINPDGEIIMQILTMLNG